MLVSTFNLPVSFIQKYANWIVFQRLLTESSAAKKLDIDTIGLAAAATEISWNYQTITHVNRTFQENLVRMSIVSIEQIADTIALDDSFLTLCIEHVNNNCSRVFWKSNQENKKLFYIENFCGIKIL